MTRAEASQEKGWSDGIEQEYYMDQFLQSLTSFHLKRWLDVFEPSQFVLVPMKEYFVNVTFRKQVLSHMGRKWNDTLDASLVSELTAEHQGTHPILEKDLDASIINELNSKFIVPETTSLVNLLAESMPR